MLNEIKVSAYAVAAVFILSFFVLGIEPMLLYNPPGGLALVAVVFVVAIMLYILSFGPLWILQRTARARSYLRTQLSGATVVFTIGIALCAWVPIIPTVGSIVSGSFAGAALLLRAVANDKTPRLRIPGEWVG